MNSAKHTAEGFAWQRAVALGLRSGAPDLSKVVRRCALWLKVRTCALRGIRRPSSLVG